MSQIAYETILKEKVVAIVRGFAPETVLELAKAYLAGGVRCVEVTFPQNDPEGALHTAATIRLLKETLGDRLCVGAGTVMTAEQVRLAAEAGAEYMISPNVDEKVIRETKKLGKVSIPGAMTPTEIALGYKLGGDIIKLFPANEVGLSYIKAVKAPLKHIPIMATGGVRPANAKEYLAAGSSALGVGGDLVNKAWISEGSFDKIAQAAKDYADAVK